MALLFALGLMSLLWMAAIAVFILFEKLLPAGQWFARIGGVLMLGFGIYLIASAIG
jgi:predicted metal-binding membrane protein